MAQLAYFSLTMVYSMAQLAYFSLVFTVSEKDIILQQPVQYQTKFVWPQNFQFEEEMCKLFFAFFRVSKVVKYKFD